MRLIVLGAAAGGGFPQWNSACPVGRRAWQRDPAARWRTQCSLALSADGERWVLLNASPDLRQQILATPALHPQARPAPQPDRRGRADQRRRRSRRRPAALCARARPSRCTPRGAILAVLAEQPDLRRAQSRVRRARASPDRSSSRSRSTAGGSTVVPFAVPGKVPLYLEDDAPAIGAETEDTIGLELRAGAGERAFFIPAARASRRRSPARLRGAALVLFDGTLWRDDEMIRSGTGAKTGARMGHMSIIGPDGTLAAFATARRTAQDLHPHQQHQPDPARRFGRASGGRGGRLGSGLRRHGDRAVTPDR